MQIIHTVAALRAALKNQASIAFVPTMGNLHAGHIHLVEIARQHAECVVVSIFVNPLQFGPNEDLASYPRTLEADCEKLETVGAGIVFAPSAGEMYPEIQTMTITPPPIASELCGASRPGHFAGVATVVMKLFNMVFFNGSTRQVAVFGKKDFQQLFIIKELVKQFNLPIEIIAGETVREADGLAMSSRNGYLSAQERASATQLNSALQGIANAINSGNKTFPALETTAIQQLSQAGWQVDYIAVRSAETLLIPKESERELVVLGAAKIGTTRLIDNLTITI
ncbi:MAG: pantoate--beta-alanine ligase [Methylotenera sp.]